MTLTKAPCRDCTDDTPPLSYADARSSYNDHHTHDAHRCVRFLVDGAYLTEQDDAE